MLMLLRWVCGLMFVAYWRWNGFNNAGFWLRFILCLWVVLECCACWFDCCLGVGLWWLVVVFLLWSYVTGDFG